MVATRISSSANLLATAWCYLSTSCSHGLVLKSNPSFLTASEWAPGGGVVNLIVPWIVPTFHLVNSVLSHPTPPYPHPNQPSATLAYHDHNRLKSSETCLVSHQTRLDSQVFRGGRSQTYSSLEPSSIHTSKKSSRKHFHDARVCAFVAVCVCVGVGCVGGGGGVLFLTDTSKI